MSRSSFKNSKNLEIDWARYPKDTCISIEVSVAHIVSLLLMPHLQSSNFMNMTLIWNEYTANLLSWFQGQFLYSHEHVLNLCLETDYDKNFPYLFRVRWTPNMSHNSFKMSSEVDYLSDPPPFVWPVNFSKFWNQCHQLFRGQSQSSGLNHKKKAGVPKYSEQQKYGNIWKIKYEMTRTTIFCCFYSIFCRISIGLQDCSTATRHWISETLAKSYRNLGPDFLDFRKKFGCIRRIFSSNSPSYFIAEVLDRI